MIAVILHKTYQWILSPAIHTLAGPGSGCRFEMTCSEYFFLQVKKRGWIKGGAKGLWRVLHCHPWGKKENFENPMGDLTKVE